VLDHPPLLAGAGATAGAAAEEAAAGAKLEPRKRKERGQQRWKPRRKVLGKQRQPRAMERQQKERRLLVGKILGLDKRIRQRLVERDR